MLCSDSILNKVNKRISFLAENSSPSEVGLPITLRSEEYTETVY